METISTSPTKRFEVRAEVWEARNSLWVYSPSIWTVDPACNLFSFRDECWSVEKSVWLSEATVRLLLRKFPGNHLPDHLLVAVDCLTSVAVLQATAKFASVETPLDGLEATLNHVLTWK